MHRYEEQRSFIQDFKNVGTTSRSQLTQSMMFIHIEVFKHHARAHTRTHTWHDN